MVATTTATTTYTTTTATTRREIRTNLYAQLLSDIDICQAIRIPRTHEKA